MAITTTTSPPDKKPACSPSAPYAPNLEELAPDPGGAPAEEGADVPDHHTPPLDAGAPTPRRPRRTPYPEPEALSDRVPPRDFDAEQAVLGSMLLEPGAAARAFAIVSPEDFYWEDHRAVCQAMVSVGMRNEPVDLVTVSAELRRNNLLQQIGGGQYLTALIGQVPTAAHVVRYATIVAEKAVLRRLIEAGGQIQDLGYANGANVGETVTKAAALTQPIIERLRPPQAPTLRTGLEIKELGNRPEWEWDQWIMRRHLNSLIGPAGAGKTFVGLGIAKPCVTGCPWPDGTPYEGEIGPLLYLDYEAFEDVIVERAEAMGIPLEMLLFQPIDDLCYLNRPDAEATIASWIQEAAPKMFIVDAWRASIPGEDENDSASGRFAAMLNRIAYIHDTTALAHHHVRKVMRGKGWTLTQDDARGSGAALDANSRCMLGIERPDGGSETLRLRVLKKNRGAVPEALGFTLDDSGLHWTDAPRGGRRTEAYDRAVESVLSIIEQEGPLHYSELAAALKKLPQPISASTMQRVMTPPAGRPAVIMKGNDGRWGPISRRQ
jgi:hypothetical protein